MSDIKAKNLILVFASFLLAMPSQAEVIIVDDELPWVFHNIQDAIDYSTNGDIIVVLTGTFTGEGNHDIDFKSKAITIQSIDPADPHIVAETTIDCEGARGFYFYSGEDTNSIIDGLTITNGYAQTGGGIYCEHSNPRITNCIIKDNTAQLKGGGIGCGFDGNPTITNCTIISNSAGWGGGISGHYGDPQIINCTINGNSAEWNGGGISCQHNSPTIINCTITDNSASGGGGIEFKSSNPTITSCMIEGNRANTSYGGGIAAWNDVNITNCNITGNYASWAGGGIYCQDDNQIINNCIITGNSAGSRGGGIYGKVNHQTIRNCTIVNNTAPNGHGVAGNDSGMMINNCIIRNGGKEIWNDGGWVSITYSNVQGNWAGDGNIDINPIFVNAGIGDYHLSALSPCINAGDPGYMPTHEEDIDGDPRVIMTRIDMGADEYVCVTPFIQISPEHGFEFFAYKDGPNPESKVLSIRNIGIGTMLWEITEDCPWIEAVPLSGVSSGEINSVTLKIIDANTLEIGNYSCTLTISDPNAANNPKIVSVDLHVGAILRVSEQFATIQEGIDAAADYDMVLVADGTYTGEGNTNLDFKGKTITVRSENGSDNCIIDCQHLYRAFYFHSNETNNSLVSGFTLTNGIAQSGGAIYCEQSSPTIANCVISFNSTYDEGGGICCQQSNPTITNCTINFNTAGFVGGGIHCCLDSSPIISNCAISINAAILGGGICCMESNLTLSNCLITDNLAIDDGGGIFCCDGTITNCTISNNMAGDNGGGLYRCSGPISNCIVWNNMAQNQGNQFYRSNNTITYSCVQGLAAGLGNINTDPCFVDAYNGDYHLKSEGWRWDKERRIWIWDDVTSRCIDMGNPGTELGEEPLTLDVDPENCFGQNLRINMGAYGGTAKASMPPYDWVILSDITNDGTVNFIDFAYMAIILTDHQNELFGDFDKNGRVGMEDLELLIEDWLQTTSWYAQ